MWGSFSGARRRVALDVGREHPVELRDVEVGVADERVVDSRPLGLLDVLRPYLVVRDGVDYDVLVFGISLGITRSANEVAPR